MYQLNPFLTEGIVGNQLNTVSKPSKLGKIALKNARKDLADSWRKSRRTQEKHMGEYLSGNHRWRLNKELVKDTNGSIKSALFKVKHPLYGGIVVPAEKAIRTVSQFTPLPL